MFSSASAPFPRGRGQGHEHRSTHQQHQRLPPRRKRRWPSRSRQTQRESNNGSAQRLDTPPEAPPAVDPILSGLAQNPQPRVQRLPEPVAHQVARERHDHEREPRQPPPISISGGAARRHSDRMCSPSRLRIVVNLPYLPGGWSFVPPRRRRGARRTSVPPLPHVDVGVPAGGGSN
jgi:hypothetical protein